VLAGISAGVSESRICQPHGQAIARLSAKLVKKK
jgi:DNA-directed RNA polymerase specialized sigma subunit